MVSKSKLQNYKILGIPYKSFILRLCIVLIFTIILAVFLPPKTFNISQSKSDDILHLLTSLLLITIFLERALEVLVSIYRCPKKSELENKSANSESESSSENLELQKYKSETKQQVLYVGLFFGILISVLGIRILESFIIPPPQDIWEVHVFRVIDTFLTGFVIAGGSEGMHQILKVFFQNQR
ncbi:MAG: hypothetical protein PUP92_00070 [Rhizonema sp. PD38]|nr:hypothetical protein [Rhizonema sp. PD38]